MDEHVGTCIHVFVEIHNHRRLVIIFSVILSCRVRMKYLYLHMYQPIIEIFEDRAFHEEEEAPVWHTESARIFVFPESTSKVLGRDASLAKTPAATETREVSWRAVSSISRYSMKKRKFQSRRDLILPFL